MWLSDAHCSTVAATLNTPVCAFFCVKGLLHHVSCLWCHKRANDGGIAPCSTVEPQFPSILSYTGLLIPQCPSRTPARPPEPFLWHGVAKIKCKSDCLRSSVVGVVGVGRLLSLSLLPEPGTWPGQYRPLHQGAFIVFIAAPR